jgi:hypothetical protein
VWDWATRREAGAAAAAEKASIAKDRIERLAKGEDVSGGLGKPMTLKDYEKIFRDAGWTAADIRFSKELHHSLRSDEEFEAFVQQNCEIMHRAEKSSRWKVCARYAPSAAVTHSGGERDRSERGGRCEAPRRTQHQSA